MRDALDRLADAAEGGFGMSEMLERIARAIADWTYATQHEDSDEDWRDMSPIDKSVFFDAARAVVKIMRDPDEAMMAEGCQWYDDYERSWQAMIDVILANPIEETA